MSEQTVAQKRAQNIERKQKEVTARNNRDKLHAIFGGANALNLLFLTFEDLDILQKSLYYIPVNHAVDYFATHPSEEKKNIFFTLCRKHAEQSPGEVTWLSLVHQSTSRCILAKIQNDELYRITH